MRALLVAVLLSLGLSACGEGIEGTDYCESDRGENAAACQKES